MSIRSFFSRKPQTTVSKNLRLVFHRDTRGLGMHGEIIATHADHNLNEAPVRFSFMGLQKAPQLTPEIMALIWEKAEAAGFIVHYMANYGTVMTDLAAEEMNDIVSQERLVAESRFTAPQTVPAMDRLPKNAPAVFLSVMEQMQREHPVQTVEEGQRQMMENSTNRSSTTV